MRDRRLTPNPKKVNTLTTDTAKKIPFL